jgi:hypothetical protein
MAITYTSGFQHADWIDNVDRVQAAGDNGFNVRFHDLEDEFDKISDAVKLISDALQALQPPAGIVDLLSVFPTQCGGEPQPFDQGVDGLKAPPEAAPDADSAFTFIPITLPNGAEIRSLRAVGEIVTTGTGGMAAPVRLQRRQLTTDPNVDPLDRIAQVTPDTNGPFDIKREAFDIPSIPGLRAVDNNRFSYFLRVSWVDGGPKPRSANFVGFQIAYVTT